jgi:hypothetical protein
MLFSDAQQVAALSAVGRPDCGQHGCIGAFV